MQNPYKPKHDYTCEEFTGHFDHFVRSDGGTSREALMRYFTSKYTNRSEGLHKMNRFGTAMAYLMRHLGDFEAFVIVGDHGRGLVSAPIVIALWRYYGAIPDEHLSDEPAADFILRMAREESES